MSDTNREHPPQDDIGLEMVCRDWTTYNDQTRWILENMLT
ncbi:hypothetical protein KSC_024610 [Ktedonobacter sp. SOSP1-52]|nr:hypothetical protein KSC_024610 [Ktedonobacter sp. SOSP1-52]